MKYETQELELDIPQPYQDKTVNALLFSADNQPGFNLVISRDVLPKGENLQGVVKKQLKVISSQESFKETEPQGKRSVASAQGRMIDATEISVRFKSRGTVYYQKHLYLLLDEKRLLILVATATGLWEEKDSVKWKQFITTLKIK